MDQSSIAERDLILLEQIEQNPDINQSSLADQIGVAVGTVNWHLKRLISKGYVKVSRLERKKLRYLITPEGLALQAKLTVDYVQTSFRTYRLVRDRMQDVISQVRQHHFDTVKIKGSGEVADVCRLSCIEQGIKVVGSGDVPKLEIIGFKIFLHFPEAKEESELK